MNLGSGSCLCRADGAESAVYLQDAVYVVDCLVPLELPEFHALFFQYRVQPHFGDYLDDFLPSVPVQAAGLGEAAAVGDTSFSGVI